MHSSHPFQLENLFKPNNQLPHKPSFYLPPFYVGRYSFQENKEAYLTDLVISQIGFFA